MDKNGVDIHNRKLAILAQEKSKFITFILAQEKSKFLTLVGIIGPCLHQGGDGAPGAVHRDLFLPR
jgi:hypothetical protein